MSDAPPWLTTARNEIGVKEIPGPNRSNARIEEYLHTATHAGPHATEDVPWCAAFVGWCLQQNGIKGTGALAARSYLKWGIPLREPTLGCITVLWRESPKGFKGHIGFWIAEDVSKVVLLGGNQHNAVQASGYTKERVLGYRWPSAASISGMTPEGAG